MNQNIELANIVLQFLRSIGVNGYFLSPGYRCLPLYSAIDKLQLNACSVIDERICGFQALGFTKSKKGIAVACSTSGSATSHFSPALIEAYHSRTPMVVITCDRPEELRGSDSNQTINQVGMFTNFIGAEFHLNNANDFNLEIQESIRSTLLSDNLPVHINISFDEPLENSIFELCELNFINTKEVLDIDLTNFPIDLNNTTLIVIGELNEGFNSTIEGFIKNYRGPLYIDISSEFFEKFKKKNIIRYFDHPSILSWFNEECSQVIHIGRKLVTNNYYRVLEKRDDLKEIWLSDFFPEKVLGNRTDSTGDVSLFSFSNLKSFENKNWNKIVSKVSRKYKSLLKPFSHGSFVSEFNEINDFDIVFLGNSSVVRAFQEQGISKSEIILNRGVSGIDGNISTSIGIALANPEKKVCCILGDLAFLHDFSSIFNMPENLKVIVLQNNRGGIFSHLPINNQVKEQPNLEKYIMTPHKSAVFEALDSFILYGGEVQGILSEFFHSKKQVAQYIINHEYDVKFYEEVKSE